MILCPSSFFSTAHLTQWWKGNRVYILCSESTNQRLAVSQRLTNIWTCKSVMLCACYLSRQQSVGVETLHVGNQVVLGVDDIFHEHAVEKEPVGPAVHADAFWDLTVPQPPHVGVALVEQTIQTLLTDKPNKQTKSYSYITGYWKYVNYQNW